MHPKFEIEIKKILEDPLLLTFSKAITPDGWATWLSCVNFSAPFRLIFMTEQEKNSYKLYLETINTIDPNIFGSNDNKEVCDE